jgi:maleate cis-trans isomerase
MVSEALEYARDGLIGVLTPQANTTAEPELGILCPSGHALLSARLTSDKTTIEARLVDYVDTLEATLDRFANAPLSAVVFACTGASYLVEPAREAETVATITARRGYQLITAADAVFDALTVLGAGRVGLVSPYGGALHDACLAYWQGRGVNVAKVARIDSADRAFHPIYALGSGKSREAADFLGKGIDAVAFLGTGLPTLRTICDMAGGPVPAISPNLCLMWRAVHAVRGTRPDGATLREWLTARSWGPRLHERLGR